MAGLVEPFVSDTESYPKLYVTPQEHYDLVYRELESDASEINSDISASLDEADTGACGLDSRFHVRVTELVYPGRIDAAHRDIATISDKWLYVYLGRDLVVEALADGPDNWAAEVGEVGSNGEIFLDPGPEGSEHTYTFFLSPIMLSPSAKAELVAGDALDQSGVAVTTNRRNILVPVRDPLHWAADAHAEYYLPRLRAWKRWMMDPTRQSELFIASVLDSWIKTDDDTFSVARHLVKGQPQRWIDGYKHVELALRTDAETACAYLAQVVDSVAYRAIELSGMHWGGQDLAHVIQALACVTQRLNECDPGRSLASRLVDDAERLPAQYIFTDDPPQNGQDFFPTFRYSWLAALSIFDDLVPNVASKLAVQGRSPIDDIQRYLDHLGLDTLKGAYKQAHRNIEAGKDLAAGVKKKNRTKYRQTIKRLEKKAGAWVDTVPTSTQNVGQSVERLHADFDKRFGKIVVSVTAVLEIANLAIAVRAYLSAEGGDANKALLGMIGAGADMGILVLDIVESMGAGSKKALRVLGGAAMVVSGVCDAVGFAQEAHESAGQHDYNSAVGSSVAAAGALIGSGVGFAMMLGVAGATGPVGLGILAVGAVLIVGGTVAAAWLRDTPHQEFAEHCFLGAHPTGDDRKKEAGELVAMLSHFQLKRAGDNDDIYITPGMVDEGCTFEVVIKHEFGNPRLDPTVDARVLVHLDTDDIEQVSGATLKPESVVVRNDDGFVTSIRIHIEPDGRTRTGVHEMLWVWARLQRRGGTTPENGRWLYLKGWRQGSLPVPPDKVNSSNPSDVVDG